MRLYRLVREKYLDGTLSGEGARRGGGRWNNKGISMVYTSEHPALALLEMRAHIVSPATPPIDYHMVVIDCPESSILTLSVADLPQNWDSTPIGPKTTEIGDQFIGENEFLVLRVPSAVLQIGNNFLLNPKHALMKEVSVIQSYVQKFDPRLFG
jgi:RES domain-containing protein